MEKFNDLSQGSENKPKMVPITEVEAFNNSTFLKLHAEGKITLTDDRRHPISFEDPNLAEFASKYKARGWPLFINIALHPEMQDKWKPDSYNSVGNEYPRVFVHRQFSEETPPLFKAQERHLGIAIDDIEVPSLPDTYENLFTRNRLTEGDVESRFFLQAIPNHKVIDLRDIDSSIKNLGSVLEKTNKKEEFEAMLGESQFNKDRVEKIREMMQEDLVFKEQIALIIINNNSALVLDPKYLIDIDAIKGKLTTEDLGPVSMSENILKSEAFFISEEIPEDINEFIKEVLNLYNLYGFTLTARQEKQLDPRFVEFKNLRNGHVHDELFSILYKKISILKKLPAEKLDQKQRDFLQKLDYLNEDGNRTFNEWISTATEELDDRRKDTLHMDAFQEPLMELIKELKTLTEEV